MKFDEPTPEERARWVESAVAAFVEMTNGQERDPHSQLRGVLSNLLEWADRQGVDFDSALGGARIDYEMRKGQA